MVPGMQGKPEERMRTSLMLATQIEDVATVSTKGKDEAEASTQAGLTPVVSLLE